MYRVVITSFLCVDKCRSNYGVANVGTAHIIVGGCVPLHIIVDTKVRVVLISQRRNAKNLEGEIPPSY